MPQSLRLASSPTALAPTTDGFGPSRKQCRIPYSSVATTKIGFCSLDSGEKRRVLCGEVQLRNRELQCCSSYGVDKDTFGPSLKPPIAPKYKALSEKYVVVVFLKLDCNPDNRPSAKEWFQLSRSPRK